MSHTCPWNHLFDRGRDGFELLSQTGVRLLQQIKGVTFSALQTPDSPLSQRARLNALSGLTQPRPAAAACLCSLVLLSLWRHFERALSDVGLKLVWAVDDGADWRLLILAFPSHEKTFTLSEVRVSVISRLCHEKLKTLIQCKNLFLNWLRLILPTVLES